MVKVGEGKLEQKLKLLKVGLPNELNIPQDTQIIFIADFASQGVSIKMLQWLDGARTPPEYFIMCLTS